METRVSLKHFVSYGLFKHVFDCNSLQTLQSLSSLLILVTLRLFAVFQPEIRAIKLQNSAKVCFNCELLFRAFH